VFLVKSIATALSKVNKGARRVSPPPDEDPWAGLFYPDDHSYGMDEDDEDDDDDDDDDDDEVLELSDSDVFSYDDDDEPYEGLYVDARWEPPHSSLDPDDFFEDLTTEQISLLGRGATLPMIETYDMQYAHERGISAYVDDYSQVYLGWNIALSADDLDGSRYMNWIYSDVFDRRERWDVTMIGGDGIENAFEARRLVRADEVDEYSDTDSDDYD
jgi:hypothetical protein